MFAAMAELTGENSRSFVLSSPLVLFPPPLLCYLSDLGGCWFGRNKKIDIKCRARGTCVPYPLLPFFLFLHSLQTSRRGGGGRSSKPPFSSLPLLLSPSFVSKTISVWIDGYFLPPSSLSEKSFPSFFLFLSHDFAVVDWERPWPPFFSSPPPTSFLASRQKEREQERDEFLFFLVASFSLFFLVLGKGSAHALGGIGRRTTFPLSSSLNSFFFRFFRTNYKNYYIKERMSVLGSIFRSVSFFFLIEAFFFPIPPAPLNIESLRNRTSFLPSSPPGGTPSFFFFPFSLLVKEKNLWKQIKKPCFPPPSPPLPQVFSRLWCHSVRLLLLDSKVPFSPPLFFPLPPRPYSLSLILWNKQR